MRGVLPIALVLAVVVAGVLLVALPDGDEAPEYRAVFDNAFGLTEGVDLKANGVRIGSVEDLDVERATGRALVTFAVERDDFGNLRRDAFCRIEPQSLIGEYFLNCEPGTSPEELDEGATIPVEQTGTVVPPDLVQNVMRRPYRERLQILLSEFGAGFATRGEDLRLAIRRAIPALRETDRVLRILADERRELRSLIDDSDTVLARLAGNRGDVARFVSEARDTARASANRRVELAQTIDRMPPFLRELRPTLAELRTVARRQTPALRDLRISAGDLTTLFERLGPFTEAARPAVRSLGEASVVGREATDEARSTIERVRRLGVLSRQPTTNLRFVLEHLDDRRFAVERSPIYGGRRLTGYEAFLQYPFVQSQAVNLFTDRGYFLKIGPVVNECVAYTDAESAEANLERTEECNTYLGPNQYGVNIPPAEPGNEVEHGEGAEPTAEAATREAVEALADYLLGP